MLTPSQILNLQEGERVIVHRGLSAPICPYAEGNYIISSQSRNGLERRRVGLYIPVQDAQGQIELRLKGATDVSLKGHGEPNGIITSPQDAPLNNWWCHILELEGFHLGLLGRPNKKRMSVHYQPPFQHEVSTNKWNEALKQLHSRLEEYAPIERALRYPRLAAAYDVMQQPMDGSLPHGSAWIFNC